MNWISKLRLFKRISQIEKFGIAQLSRNNYYSNDIKMWYNMQQELTRKNELMEKEISDLKIKIDFLSKAVVNAVR